MHVVLKLIEGLGRSVSIMDFDQFGSHASHLFFSRPKFNSFSASSTFLAVENLKISRIDQNGNKL